jgi:hypothetical protein
MSTTYEKIASVTVGSGGAADIEFTSIPATFDDLVFVLSARSNRSVTHDDIRMNFNNNSANYSDRTLYGTGSSVASYTNAYSGSNAWVASLNGATSTSSTFTSVSIYIPNYAGSTNKSYSIDAVSENNATEAIQFLSAGLWSNTSAIASVKFIVSNTFLFVQHSTATLYGIKKS